MKEMVLNEYSVIPKSYHGIWIVGRWDLPDRTEIREEHISRRTMMVNDNDTCLSAEGIGFETVDDNTQGKPDEVRQEIGGPYLKFYSKQGCEPRCTGYIIRWYDTLEIVKVRVALTIDSDMKKDDEMFFCYNSLKDLKSLTDKGGEDFIVVGCLDFGICEELSQTT